MGATLIFMREPVNVIAGIVTLVMPFIVGYIVYRFNPPGREHKPEPPRDEPGPEAPEPVVQPPFPS
ncbi:hypothetical protein D3C73_1668710 [compost metagenome]